MLQYSNAGIYTTLLDECLYPYTPKATYRIEPFYIFFSTDPEVLDPHNLAVASTESTGPVHVQEWRLRYIVG